MTTSTPRIRALTFDVFGTILNVQGQPWVPGYIKAVRDINRGLALYRSPTVVFGEIKPVWGDCCLYPGALKGFRDLGQRFLLAALSNAGTDVGNEIADLFHLPWSHIVPTEQIPAYKPDLRLYHLALTTLGTMPDQTLHVAAHRFDLDAAKTVGFQTAYLRRPGEDSAESVGDDRFDYVVDTLLELNGKL